jgi:hypothetical protein
MTHVTWVMSHMTTGLIWQHVYHITTWCSDIWDMLSRETWLMYVYQRHDSYMHISGMTHVCISDMTHVCISATWLMYVYKRHDSGSTIFFLFSIFIIVLFSNKKATLKYIGCTHTHTKSSSFNGKYIVHQPPKSEPPKSLLAFNVTRDIRHETWDKCHTRPVRFTVWPSRDFQAGQLGCTWNRCWQY